jgi:multiple sugar transport system permease protein
MSGMKTALGIRIPSNRHLRGKVIQLLLCVLVLGVFLLPIWSMIATAFNGMPLKSGQISLVPREFTFANFTQAWNFGAARGLFNSLVVVAIALTLQMAASSLAAYSLARKKFRGMSIVMVLILATMMMPQEIIAIPLYLVLGQIPAPTASGSLLNSFGGLILPLVGWALPIYVLTGFMRTIPLELEEAARIDGASDIRIFLRIILPLCRPALGTCGVFGFLMIWDQYLLPLLVAQTPDMYTLTLIVTSLQSSELLGEGVRLAAAVILMVPGVIVFLALQKFFEGGLMGGSLKG